MTLPERLVALHRALAPAAKLAGLCGQHLEKGRQVAVNGRLGYSECETEDASKRSKHEIVANDVEFLAKAKAPNEEQAGGEQGDEDIPL